MPVAPSVNKNLFKNEQIFVLSFLSTILLVHIPSILSFLKNHLSFTIAGLTTTIITEPAVLKQLEGYPLLAW